MKRRWLACGLAWLFFVLCNVDVAVPGFPRGPSYPPAQRKPISEPIKEVNADQPRIEIDILLVKLDGAARHRLGLPALDEPGLNKDTREIREYLHDLQRKGVIKQFSENRIVAVNGQAAWGLDGKQVSDAPPRWRLTPGSSVTVIPSFQKNGRIELGYSFQLSGPTWCRTFTSGTVQIGNGETIVLPGGSSTEVRCDTYKIPLLGDLPVCGRFFQFASSRESTEELAALVTVRLLNDTNRDDPARKK